MLTEKNSPDKKKRKKKKEEIDDIRYGLTALISFRWILVASAILLTFWNPGEMNSLRVQMIGIFILAISNFYLHTQLILKKATLTPMVYATTLFDLIIITTVIIVDGGFNTSSYIFYLPAILIYSVIFPRILTLISTLAICFIYTEIAILSNIEANQLDTAVLFIRLLIFCSIGYVGSTFTKIEEERRELAQKEQAALIATINQ